jgi:hypothetical protein
MPGSRELPRRPSLDHLKNEAKALHRAYARGDADAVSRTHAALGRRAELKLLDAQRVIAHEYGFSKWAELRETVIARLAMQDEPNLPIAQPLTTRAQVAIAIARGVARAHGHRGAGAKHVALAILREGENAAVGALQRASVPLRELRYHLERALPDRGESRGMNEPLDASPEEVAVVTQAKREATARTTSFIASEHLMLALLRDPESETSRIFAAHGVSHATFSQNLDIVLAGP